MRADPRNENSLGLQNRRVHFHIQDVYVPTPAQVLAELHGQDMVHGRIIDLSDCGAEGDSFGVVEVDGLAQPVVVPIAKIIADE